MVAAWFGRIEAVRFLIGAGADVNARSQNGFTAMVAAQYVGHAGIVNILKQAGAQAETTAYFVDIEF